MKVRHLAASLLVATVAATPAFADDVITLAPACAAIDETRDTLSPEERTAAVAQLSRALMEANLLVVEQGCTDRFSLSHEKDGERSIVRLAAPGGALRVKDPGLKERGHAYERLVEKLLEAREAREAAAREAAALEVAAREDAAREYEQREAIASEPAASAEHEEPAKSVAVVEPAATQPAETSYSSSQNDDGSWAKPTVRDDVVLYGKGLLGNYGTGIAVGLHVLVKPTVAFDLSFGGQGSDDKDIVFLAARFLGFRSPDAAASLYYGGGMSLASQTEQGGAGGGARIDGVLGVAMNRTERTRYFLEGSLGVPLYDIEGGTGPSYAPTFMLSLGIGR